MADLRAALAAGALVALAGPAWADDAPEVALYDSGWVGDTGEASSSGPVALEPIDTDFSGPADHLVVGIDDGRLMLTWMPGDAAATLEGALIPVPRGLAWDQVGLLDPDALAALDAFTQPWRWQETCGQVLSSRSSGGGCGEDTDGASRANSGGGCLSSDGSEDPDKTVEQASPGSGGAEAELGAYSAWIVEEDSAEAVLAWMDDAGFSLPDGAQPAIARHVEGGGAFLALRLRERAWLQGAMPEPVRVVLAADDAVELPVALGALGGASARDLVVIGLHDTDPWTPDVDPGGPGHCLVEPPDELGSPSVEEQLAEHWHRATGITDAGPAVGAAPLAAGWEAWLPEGRCLDCWGWDRLDPSIVRAFGVDDESPAITRTRLRAWRPTATEAVALDAAPEGLRVGIKRVVDYRWELAGLLPYCDGTEEEGGGTCFSSAWWSRRAQQDEDDREAIPTHGRRCGGSGSLLLLPLLVAGLRRRR